MSVRKGICVMVALLAIVTTSCMGAKQQTVYDALMIDRKEAQLRELPVQADAQRKAQAWANKLAAENNLYHSNLPDGIKVKWCSLGENVGYGPDVKAIEKGYMASPGHKANILDTRWNGVGVGYATNGKLVFTVQVFIKTC